MRAKGVFTNKIVESTFLPLKREDLNQKYNVLIQDFPTIKKINKNAKFNINDYDIILEFAYNDYPSLETDDFLEALELVKNTLLDFGCETIIIPNKNQFGAGIFFIKLPNPNMYTKDELGHMILDIENMENGWKFGDSYAITNFDNWSMSSL